MRSQKTLLRQGALSTLREELEEVDAEVDPKGTGKNATTMLCARRPRGRMLDGGTAFSTID